MDQESIRFPAISAAISLDEQQSSDKHLALEATSFLQLTSHNDVVPQETSSGVAHVPGMTYFAQLQQQFTEQTTESINDKLNVADDTSNLQCETNDISETSKKMKRMKNDGNHGIAGEQENSDSEAKAPGLSYIALISMAIQSSESRRMLLSEIYQWIAERYSYYQMKDKSWRNSIRHNLSLNECFIKCGRSENGKGNYWGIHPANIGDFANGDFRRRRARRQVRKCDEDLHRLCSNSPKPSETPVMLPETSSITNGTDKYVPMASSIVPGNFLSSLGFEPMKSYDYWIPNHYASTNLGAKFYSNSLYGSQSDETRSELTCSSNYPLYGFHCNPCRNSLSTISPSDSLVNVNVNVNVCSSDPSQYPPQAIECHPSQHSDSLGLRSYDAALL